MLNASLVEDLYKEHHYSVYCYAYKITKDKEDAEDLAQDFWVKLHSSHYNGQVFLTYAYSALVKNWISKHRTKKRILERDTELLHDISQYPMADARNLWDDISKLLNSCNMKQRKTLVAFLNGKSSSERNKLADGKLNFVMYYKAQIKEIIKELF